MSKQLTQEEFLKQVWQLITSTLNDTLEVPLGKHSFKIPSVFFTGISINFNHGFNSHPI